MGADDNKQLRWIFAIGLSLALHVLIVALMVGIGGDDVAPSPVVAPAKPENVEPDMPTPTQSVQNTAFTPVAPAVAAPTQGEAPSFKTYVVKSGDNLSKIAKIDGSTLAELAKLNETDVKTLSRLQPGQRIKVRNGVE